MMRNKNGKMGWVVALALAGMATAAHGGTQPSVKLKPVGPQCSEVRLEGRYRMLVPQEKTDTAIEFIKTGTTKEVDGVTLHIHRVVTQAPSLASASEAYLVNERDFPKSGEVSCFITFYFAGSQNHESIRILSKDSKGTLAFAIDDDGYQKEYGKLVRQ